MTSLQLIIFKENLIKFAMKEHTKNGGHRKDARKNHGERARGNLNKSDLHNPTELHCLCMEYSILTTLVAASHHKNFPKGYKTAAYKDA